MERITVSKTNKKETFYLINVYLQIEETQTTPELKIKRKVSKSNEKNVLIYQHAGSADQSNFLSVYPATPIPVKNNCRKVLSLGKMKISTYMKYIIARNIPFL